MIESNIEVSISDSKCSPVEQVVERVGFEPTWRKKPQTDFESVPLQPLRYLSK